MAKVLVTGGAGFIGSHTVVDLVSNGHDVIIADDFSNARPKVLEGIRRVTGRDILAYRCDLKDYEASKIIFEEHPDIDGIIHFAAHIYVNESVNNPLKYFNNNINNLLTTLRLADEYKINNFIFSSSCSVYGNAEELPVTEATPFGEAECPYARTKQMGEEIIRDFCNAKPHFKAVLLRYFNPSGAHDTGLIGEAPLVENTHLIPIITEVAIGHREKLLVFGDDYDTRDGSCIRDYIHVMDLGDAHTKAFEYIMNNRQEGNCEVFNLGIGKGVSVLEAIRAFENVTGISVNYEVAPRRAGDAAAIYANNNAAFARLGWKPKRNIEDIVSSSWLWEQNKHWIIDEE